jgi:hypothetical protein
MTIARQKVARESSRRRTAAGAVLGAFRPKTDDTGAFRHLSFGVRFINSVKRETEGDGGSSVHVLISSSWSRSPFAVDACLHRSNSPPCDSCTISGVLCQRELLKDGVRRMSCDWCRQWKVACHWDLVGIMGPWDPIALK